MNSSEILIYQNSDGNIKIDVRIEDETVWLSQAQMADLFGKGRSTITEHIQNVFEEGELEEKLVCRNFRQTSQHGAIIGKIKYRIPKIQSCSKAIEKEQSLKEIEEDIKRIVNG